MNVAGYSDNSWVIIVIRDDIQVNMYSVDGFRRAKKLNTRKSYAFYGLNNQYHNDDNINNDNNNDINK